MVRQGGLKKRWLLNTLGVVFALGMACVIAVTLVFSGYYYSGMESDLSYRAETTTGFFSEYMDLSYNEYYQSCVLYAKGFEERNTLELQFIDANGRLVASSYGVWVDKSPETSDIREAIQMRVIRKFSGKDPLTGERIIAVSSPMIYANGEVIGVLRYVTSTHLLDQQVLRIALLAFAALGIVMLVVAVSSSYYLRSIVLPVVQITRKAKRITGGSYGIQIETHYDDEIGELANTINEMSMQISQNERLQQEFISSLSHELRTPLTAITGWSETLLAYEDMDRETRRGVKIILKESQRLTEMVTELLEFTRAQDGRMTLDMRQTDIQTEFEDTVFMYSSRLSREEIKLEYLDSMETLPGIVCDPERMRQVFLNLLDNAAKHGGEGGIIEASAVLEGEEVVFRIRDYGPGIPEDELPLVKKKFYKGSSKARGTGIGLALCEEIVSMHNGSLILENATGGGTLVTVRLPVYQ